MTHISSTPEPPYYAVIFTSHRTGDEHAYNQMAEEMVTLAAQQPGFLGIESARDNVGITVSYWSDLEAIKNWKANTRHRVAQQAGRAQWYSAFHVRIAKVERDYRFD